MVRQNKNTVHVQPPNDPNFISIPISLTKTVHDDMFLRCDTGPGMFLYLPKTMIMVTVYTEIRLVYCRL